MFSFYGVLDGEYNGGLWETRPSSHPNQSCGNPGPAGTQSGAAILDDSAQPS